MNKYYFFEVILTLFVIIGFLELIGLAFTFMNASSTISFAGGITVFALSFYGAWYSITSLWKEHFKNYITKSKETNKK
jgi:hypothetical protein